MRGPRSFRNRFHPNNSGEIIRIPTVLDAILASNGTLNRHTAPELLRVGVVEFTRKDVS